MAKKKDVKPIFVNIRCTNEYDILLINKVVQATGEKTNTGAMMKAARRFLVINQENSKLETEVELLKKQLLEANRILNLYHTAQSNLAGYGKKFLSGKHMQNQLF